MPPPPHLTIEPLTPTDAPRYQAIRHAAFRHDVNKILYAREPSTATQDAVVAKIREDLAKGVKFLVCRDKVTDEVIAGARWRFVGPKEEDAVDGVEDVVAGQEVATAQPIVSVEKAEAGVQESERMKKPRYLTEDERAAHLTAWLPFPESDPEVFERFWSTYRAYKIDIMGFRPYWDLDTLITHPDHHRRGAGGLLVNWGCERADEMDVEAYLEATPMGRPLYERYGFVAVKEVEFCTGKAHGDEMLTFILMRRPAKSERESG